MGTQREIDAASRAHMAHVIVSCMTVSICHVIYRKIGHTNLSFRGVKKWNSALIHAKFAINELTREVGLCTRVVIVIYSFLMRGCLQIKVN